ncbi:hypothetical protein DIPPA_17795 [Diplonema papillatum]|nr:hypothetical protein DIPPA_17795 [Diplonema papillatum]
MDSLPVDHQQQLSTVLWKKLVNGREFEPLGTEDETATATANQSIGDRADTSGTSRPPKKRNLFAGPAVPDTLEPFYYVKLSTAQGSYSCIVVNKSYSRVWLGYADRQTVVRMVKKKPLLVINPEAVCTLITKAIANSSARENESGADTGESVDPMFSGTSVNVREAAPSENNGQAKPQDQGNLQLTICCELKLADKGSSLPLTWTIELEAVPPGEQLPLMSKLVIQPLLGVCRCLSYSHSLFQSSILLRDRELKQYRDVYGPLDRGMGGPGMSKRSVALNPDTYVQDLLSSAAVSSKMSSASLSSVGDAPSHALAHHNIAPALYELYMKRQFAAPQSLNGPSQAGPGHDLEHDRVILDNSLDLREGSPKSARGLANNYNNASNNPASPLKDFFATPPSSPAKKKQRLDGDEAARTQTSAAQRAILPLQKSATYVETEDERARRLELEEKLSQAPKTKVDQSKAMKKKMKNIFK